MRSIMIGAALALALTFPALAQQPSPSTPVNQSVVVANCGTPNTTYPAGQPMPDTQNTSGQKCIVSSGGGGGAVTIADGADITLGAKADGANCATTNSLIACVRQLHADLIAPLPAGTNLLGSVVVNQAPYSRRVLVVVTFTPGGTYAIGQAIGATGAGNAKFTIPAGIGNSADCIIESVTYSQPASALVTVGNSTTLYVFRSAPAGAYTDGSLIPNTDMGIVAAPLVFSNSGGTATTTTWFVKRAQPSQGMAKLTTDASGNIFAILAAGATESWTTPGVGTIVLQIAY